MEGLWLWLLGVLHVWTLIEYNSPRCSEVDGGVLFVLGSVHCWGGVSSGQLERADIDARKISGIIPLRAPTIQTSGALVP